MLKIYKISQTENGNWDTYDAAIVCASSPEEAKTIHPDGGKVCKNKALDWVDSPDKVQVEEIGTANEKQKRGLILASFNAG